MVIIVCTDDATLRQTAVQQAQANQATYGQCYQPFTTIPSLGVNENLFITAHGARDGDDGNPVIGDENNAMYFNAVMLWEALEGIFPRGYRGSVYISACESSNPKASLSFAEVFRAQLHGARRQAGRVYGQKGSVGMNIPGPNDPDWTQA
jgi:hypothetical protein